MLALRTLFRAPSAPSKWLTLSAACLGLAMLMIDSFVVNVAFPAIGRDLHADLSTAEWTVSGYVLVLAIFPIIMGRLGDIFGRRKVYLIGLSVFVAASAACGAAPSIELLVAFRLLQGLGAAIMMPGTLSLITHAFPEEQRGLAIGIWSGVSGLGLIAGPILGGLLVQGDNWRLIFYVNLPLGLLALAMALRFVPESRDEHVPPVVDWLGLALLTTSLFLIMLGVSRGSKDGWTGPIVLACFTVGLALLAVFVAAERRVRYPLIDLSLFRNTTFVMACLSAFLFSAAVFGAQPFTSLFMQNTWGFTPLQGGLAFVPATILVALLMPVSGIMGQRLGARMRLIVIAGSLMVALSFVYLLRLDVTSGYLDGFLPAFLLRGAGIGLVMSATSFAVVTAAPLAKVGLASGTLTMARNLGTAMGVAIFGTVYLQYIDGAMLPLQTGGVLPANLKEIMAAAEHFVVTADLGYQAYVLRAVVDGFIHIAFGAVVITSLATLAAVFIRPQRSPTPVRSLTPTGAVPAIEA
jgi:DHA2 family methylenomycin A resistance protein-like MFS transporter